MPRKNKAPDGKTKDTNREAVRVEASFPIEFVVLDPEEIKETLQEVQNHSTSDRLGTPPPSNEGLPSGLKELQDFQNMSASFMRMWQSIDSKLDALIKIVGNQVHKLVNAQSAIVKNISSKGIRLKTNKRLLREKYILMRMSPPSFPSFTIDSVGKVITSEPDEEEGYRSHVEYSALNPDDREILITYIFKRQREILRGQLPDH